MVCVYFLCDKPFRGARFCYSEDHLIRVEWDQSNQVFYFYFGKLKTYIKVEQYN